MGFSTAISGLNAASNMLSVTGNNIANSNTTGFKSSRSEFADVYSNALSKTAPGSGVAIANVSQAFTQGNLQETGNSLDLAISGDGFFVLGGSTDSIENRFYTRSGAFHTDDNGYVVSNTGKPLLAYRANGATVEEGFSTGVLEPLRIDASEGKPSATTAINTSVNLNSKKPAISATDHPFRGVIDGVVDPSSYTDSTSVTVYDSLGKSHQVTQYYVKREPGSGVAALWDVYTTVDGLDIKGTTPPALPVADQLTFDTNGDLLPWAGAAAGTTTTKIAYPEITVAPDAAPLKITLDLAGSTQRATTFGPTSLYQDGVTTGTLSSVEVNDSGVVLARFSNGKEKPLGQVAIVRFANMQGLTKVGETSWQESAESGAPLTGTAGSGAFGKIKPKNLEGSNVDLSKELVNLIIAQQAYQANAQTITTENEITRTLLQIR